MSFKLGFREKLLAAFLASAFFLLIVGGIGVWSLNRVTSTYERYAQVDVPNVNALVRMRTSAIQVSRAMFAIGLPAEAKLDHKPIYAELEDALNAYQSSTEAYL